MTARVTYYTLFLTHKHFLFQTLFFPRTFCKLDRWLVTFIPLECALDGSIDRWLITRKNVFSHCFRVRVYRDNCVDNTVHNVLQRDFGAVFEGVMSFLTCTLIWLVLIRKHISFSSRQEEERLFTVERNGKTTLSPSTSYCITRICIIINKNDQHRRSRMWTPKHGAVMRVLYTLFGDQRYKFI